MKKLLTLLCVCLLTLQLWAQTKRISGIITDKNGKPVSGASVLVKGTTVGTITGTDGSYVLNVPTTGKTLLVSSTNFETQEVSIGAKTTVTVSLTAADANLDEVVVTGYGKKKRTEFTGASTKVSAKQIEQIPIASFEQILQGRAPGLYIASGSGQPGTAARVNIRGVGSISGGVDPLYVLDGIPIEAGVFRSLNPNDFESVDVLKDAAGAGLYGSRGANGVIVITSKKGVAGRTRITYRGQAGFNQVPKQLNLKMMNTEERLRYEEEILGPAGIIPSNAITGYPGWDYSPNNPRFQTLTALQRASEAALLDSIKQINTNWADVFFRNGTFKQHEITASGGSQQGLSFFTSLSYFGQQGSILRSNLDRYTFRANLDFKTERLTVAVRSAAGFSSQQSIESEAGVALANPIAAAYLELPYRKLRRFDGQIDVGAGKTGPNAYDRIFTTTATSNQFKGTLGITVSYNIWNGIGFKSTNGIDWRNNNQSRFIDPNSFAGSLVPQGAQGSYGEGNFENLQLISTTGFTYNKVINGKHSINANLMYEAIRNKFRAFSVTGFGVNPRLPNTPVGTTGGSATNNFIPIFGGAFLPGNGKSINGISSLFGTVDYTFDKRYTVSASYRKDAPSQVPSKNRDNRFWTAGASWNIIQEQFMSKQNIFQELRVRASYGETGNINGFPNDFGYISTYGSGTYAGAPSIIPTSPGNLDYALESQIISNLGLEMSMWKKRARVTLEYYIKDSKNLFAGQNLSRTTGFRALNTNAGEVRNQGFESAIALDIVSKQDLLVTFGINGAFLRNRVRSLGLLTEIPQGTGIVRVGLPLGTHFTVGYSGVDPQSGLPVYQDINGNLTNQYNASNNRAVFGTLIPSFTGGASLDIQWKKFTFSALFTTAQNVQRFNNESFFYTSTNANIQFNKQTEMLTSTWRKPGDNTDFHRVSAQRQFSSRDVQDASFIRFRNLQFGYNFDIDAAKSPVRSARIWFQAQNLYTWTKWKGFDPEESNNIATYEFPNPKTFTVGLDINF